MKKLISITMIVLICMTVICSCSEKDQNYDPLEGRNIVSSEIHKTYDLSSTWVDTKTFEAVNELSTQIVKCKITGINYLQTTVMNTISFKFDAVVEEIYMDIGDQLDVGDSIIVSSSNGIIKASEAEELFKDDSSAKKYGIFQDGPYDENDYAVYSNFDSVPIEVGMSYVIYLSDDYLESEGVYADCGFSYTYAITDNGSVYSGADITKSDMNESELIKFVKDGIEARTGRVQEVGRSEYLSELAERQAAERNAAE